MTTAHRPDPDPSQTPHERRTIKAARPASGRGHASPVPEYRDEQAEVFGPLALLPEPPGNPEKGLPHGWAVLHVGTGRAIGPTLPDRATALRTIRLLENEDWAFAHCVYAPGSLAEKVRSVMRLVLDRVQPRKEEPGDNQPHGAEAFRPGRAA